MTGATTGPTLGGKIRTHRGVEDGLVLGSYDRTEVLFAEVGTSRGGPASRHWVTADQSHVGP